MSDPIHYVEKIIKGLQRGRIPTDSLIENLNELKKEVLHYKSKIEILTDFGLKIKNLAPDAMFETILETSRKLTNADGGTVYSVEESFSEDPYRPRLVKSKKLFFRVLQNESKGVFLGGTTGKEIPIPPVELFVEGGDNKKNVSAYCANFAEIVNLDDVYNAQGFDFSGTKKYDASFGYRSKSMLVYPLKNQEGEVLGVLQLINRRNSKGEVISFSKEDQDLLVSLAVIVALMLGSQILIHEQKELFNSFIRVIAQGLGEKSPHTYRHIRNVTFLTEGIAKAVSEERDGIYGTVRMSERDLEEITIAGWTHDIGKMTTPEHIVAKSRKLQRLTDRLEVLLLRLDGKVKDLRLEFLKAKIDVLEDGKTSEHEKKTKIKTLQRELRKKNQEGRNRRRVSRENQRRFRIPVRRSRPAHQRNRGIDFPPPLQVRRAEARRTVRNR